MQPSRATGTVHRESRAGGTGRRAERRAQEQTAARQRKLVALAMALIVVMLAALVVVRVVSGSNSNAASGPAPASLVQAITSVPAATLAQVGRGTASQLPTPVRTDVERGPTGLPLVTYIGAEYCPFCAAQRWPLIVALSRFGTFDNLQLSHSASDDVYPNTPTFSFVGSTFTSPYLEFDPVELQSNVRSGSTYQQLQTPTPAQTNLLRTYDAPPYVSASAAGSIPFTDFAGQYLVSGASLDAGTLRGMSQEQVAAALADPSTPQAQAILGSANVLTAAICSATGNTPANVCGDPQIASLQATLAATPAPGKN